MLLVIVWKTSWGLPHWETYDHPTTSKLAYDDVKEVFLAKEWNFFISLPPIHVYSQIHVWIVLEATIDSTTMQYNCWLPHLKHILVIEIGQWTTIPISRDTRLCHFCSYDVVEMRHVSCWSVPYTTALEINFHCYLRMQFQGEQACKQYMEIMLMYTRTITFFDQMPISTSVLLFNLDFPSWHPLLCVRYSNIDIKPSSSKPIIKNIAQKIRVITPWSYLHEGLKLEMDCDPW